MLRLVLLSTKEKEETVKGIACKYCVWACLHSTGSFTILFCSLTIPFTGPSFLFQCLNQWTADNLLTGPDIQYTGPDSHRTRQDNEQTEFKINRLDQTFSRLDLTSSRLDQTTTG